MKFCPECGVKLDNDNFKFCPECGYKFESNTNNLNQNKKSESKGFIGGFIKGIRDQIPEDYVDKIKDNETIDDAITHAKIIWHGPKTEKEKAYRERKNKEKEVKKQEKERKRQEAIEFRKKCIKEAENRDKKVNHDITHETNNLNTNGEVVNEVKEVPEESIIKESVEKETEVKIVNKIEDEKYKKESSTKQIDYSNLNLSDLQESLIKSLPIINNPAEYEENIINKYSEYNSEERKELLKDCWTITKLAEEHSINRKEVQKAILTDEFLEKDLIGVFKVNPNNIRSLKILYRKPLKETEQKQENEKPKEEPSTVTSNKDVEDSVVAEDVIKEVNEIPEEPVNESIKEVNEIPEEPVINESIKEVNEIPEEPVINESIEEKVNFSQEKTNNVSNNFTQNNRKDNNEKKQKKGIGKKIMDFNLGKTVLDKGHELVEEEKREVREKISPLLPEYAKVLNTTPDKLYVTSISESFRFRGGKYNSFAGKRDGIVMNIEDTQISYIIFGRILDKVTFFDTMDIYSFSFKNIVSIHDNVLNIDLKMHGDNTIRIRAEDYFGKRFLNELLKKYNEFNSGSLDNKNNTSNDNTSNADELLKYAELYKQGILSEEEFELIKKDLLNK